jgi:DNA repair and recombination protein RAD52
MKTFSQEQIDQLKAPLSREVVKVREQGGRNVSYVEGWHAIAEANRIFGFDCWSSETIELKCVSEKARTVGKSADPGWGVTYIAKVRLTVSEVTRDGVGAGHGIDRDLGQAHESAVKEAETDAFKRAARTFGHPFGLALYDKTQANVADAVDPQFEASQANVADAVDPQFEASRRLYIETTTQKILTWDDPDRDSIYRWWHAEPQRLARRDFDIDQPQIDQWKQLIKQKAPPAARNTT